MKTKITRLLLSVVLMMCCMAMNAQVEFTVDGIKYRVPDENENNVEVVANDPEYSGSVVIPATVTYDSKTYNVTGIANRAFSGCSSLTSITIPEGVTYIGDDAFYLCEGLEGDLVIPSTVKSIGESAFKKCEKLTSVTIKGGSIGYNAFKNCYGLTSVTIKGGSIGNNAFEGCSSLKSLSLQEGVTGIGSQAFSGCYQIEGDLVIPSTVKSIGNSAFYHCSGLTSVTIKGGSIGDRAFAECTRLTSISLQEGVTSIGSNAFDVVQWEDEESCLIIPSTVESIGAGAFAGVGVYSIKVFALVPPELGNNAFDYAIPLYVPDVEKYKKCDGWKEYSNIQPLTSFILGDQTYSLNEAGGFLAQDLTFNDKDTYVSGFDFTVNCRITYSRTFKDTNWQALYVPFAMSYSDWRDKFDVAAINNFHEYTDGEGNTVKTELEVRLVKSGTLKPNHPYLIRAKYPAPYSQSIELSTKKICKSDENSIDCSSVERKYTFTGTYRGIAGLKTNGYIFMSGGKLSKAGNDTDVLPAQRWYLHIESRGSQIDNGGYSNTPMQFDIRLLDDYATGIDEITVTRTPLKDSSNALYNLNGMRVNDSYKGIVIRNGKKFFQQ